LDLSAFLAEYRADGRGGTAYDPTMMVTLLMYAYCDGERSSRRIAEHCRTDVGYRVVTGGLLPDYCTVARFRDRHEKALAGVFVPVLAVCLDAGTGDVSFAAVDGAKFRCPASTRANRKLASIEKELARVTAEVEAELGRVVSEMLAESRRADLDDDPLPGTPPGTPREPGTLPDVVGLPRKLHGRAARRARLARAKRVHDDDHAAALAAYEALLAERAARVAATGKGISGPKPKRPARNPDKKVNVTDPDSRIMKDAHGRYLAGYNAQNAVSGDWLALASEVVDDENDLHQLHPMMRVTAENLAGAGSEKTVGLFAGDSGYRTKESLAALDPDGPAVLMPDVKERETRRRAGEGPAHEGPPPDGLTPAEEMDWILGTLEGQATYRRRASTVETRFGQVRHNRGVRSFVRVGLTAADSEWKFLNLTENLCALFRRVRAGKATPAWSSLARIQAGPG
jgi:transposase